MSHVSIPRAGVRPAARPLLLAVLIALAGIAAAVGAAVVASERSDGSDAVRLAPFRWTPDDRAARTA